MGKFTLILVGLAALGSSACADGVDGNGDRVEKARSVDAFTRIRTDCELSVQVRQGDEPSVVVAIDSNLQDLVRTSVVDGTLNIDLREDVNDVVSGPHVRVTVPALSAAKLDGSGRLAVALDAPTAPFDLFLSGSGDVRYEGRSAALGAHLSGSGEMRLAGETSDVDIALSGSGEVSARDLRAESGTLDLSGSGQISATVTESVRVLLSGSGDIDLYGGASVDELRRSGSGEFDRH
ncbi:MAG: hypothetical protein K0R38_1349 [Polyangiaceae bacterium]|jgi:hypothetical protein|nr:hypothetical protein [Polyangiaceae bacterium]